MLRNTQFNSYQKATSTHSIPVNIETGFPSPARDHLEKALNLEDLIVQRPTSTFYVRVEGNAMIKSGIHDRDILVIDRSLTPMSGSILIVAINEEILIRRFMKKGNRHYLITDDNSFPPILIYDELDFLIWGVVTHVIHKFV